MNRIGGFAAIFLLLIQLTRVCYGEVDKPYIDYLTTDYLNVEQELWQKINSQYNADQLFDEIRNEHKRFILTDFGAEVTLQNAYVPSAGILLQNVNLVNSLFYNASVLLNSSILSRVDIIFLFKSGILPKSIQYAELVYRESSRANFWQKGKDVIWFLLV